MDSINSLDFVSSWDSYSLYPYEVGIYGVSYRSWQLGILYNVGRTRFRMYRNVSCRSYASSHQGTHVHAHQEVPEAMEYGQL